MIGGVQMLCNICGKDLDSPKECAWTSCPKLFTDGWDESRIDAIGQNGNDGLHYKDTNMKYEEEYTAWLYATRSIGNGDALLHYLEDGDTYNKFLTDMGLTDE